MDWSIFLYVLAVILILVGLLGTLLPALPGTPLMLAGMFMLAWVEHFTYIGMPTLIILSVLTAISLATDLLASTLGAGKFGASTKAMFGAAIGALIGVFFAIPGLIIGPFIGAVLGELWHRRSLHVSHLSDATKIGIGTWLGLIIGTAVKVAIAFSMLAIFVLALILE